MKENIIDKLQKEQGLTDKEVLVQREKYGSNELIKAKKEPLILKLFGIFKEPMFLLLIITASVYFIVGEYNDGIIALIFVIGIFIIEFVQETKTDKALEELNKLSSLNVKVIRNGVQSLVSSDEIVVDDIIILDEGDKVPADGIIIYSQSLGINESILTGESDIVYKRQKKDEENHFKLNMCYSGTNVINGMGIIKVTAVGVNTEIGHIGSSLDSIKEEKTPLEKQTNKLVIICTIISSIVFVLTIIINFINHSELAIKERLVTSILSGITIAMATIPEEIPVILIVFLAMGAWQLTKAKALTRNMKAIETLGAINVLCIDKTGTITENKMVVADAYSVSKSFYKTAYYACQAVSYDSMENAIKKYCEDHEKIPLNNKITKEYAFTTETKMMGQIWNNKYLCVKGAYESVLPLCNLNKTDSEKIIKIIDNYSKEGYRVLAVAKNDTFKKEPKKLTEASLSFEGLIALYDPPRKGVKSALNECYKAGIRVIMITGDNGETAKGIAGKIELENNEEVITGIELEKMTDEELFEKVKTVNIFARVYPKHKMKIVNALQRNNKIVAMTGDGINDAPALKKADIGIALGEKSTNVAKEASDIILLDDNFNTIVKATENGRTIYKNIRLAIYYILAIHIPIALLSLFVPIFKLPTLILPIHVMLLELLIDPTSSIIFQKIKPSKHIMEEEPRIISEPIIDKKTTTRSIAAGLLIFAIDFLVYYLLIKKNIETNIAITVAYSVLVLSIILIAYQIKSPKLTIKTIIKDLKNKTSIIVNTSIIAGLLILIYVPFFNDVANTYPIDIEWWLLIIILSILAVIPFDILERKKR